MRRADLEIRDPICQSKNMTRNCYLYPEIKAMFSIILDRCFEGEGEPVEEEPVEEGVEGSLRNVFVELHCEMERQQHPSS